jgi:hypothetical protein
MNPLLSPSELRKKSGLPAETLDAAGVEGEERGEVCDLWKNKILDDCKGVIMFF